MAAHAKERFERAIARALERIGVAPGATMLVALSGGPDSVALTHALATLSGPSHYRLVAAHLNHQLRGADSDRDERFVRELCDRLRIDIVVDAAAALTATMRNLEEHARGARYEFLERVARDWKADHILTAHHADDQAETVMYRMLRGAGIAGLAAMREKGPGILARPMLSLTRVDVMDYLTAIDADYVTDSTNSSRAIARNRIRHDLLPALEAEYAPGLRRRLAALASEMGQLDDFISAEARAHLERMRRGSVLDLSQLLGLAPALRNAVMREFLRDQVGTLRRIDRSHIDAAVELCLSVAPNTELHLPGGIRLVREYRELRIMRGWEKPVARYDRVLEANQIVVVPEAGFSFETRILSADAAGVPENQLEALFDLGAARELRMRNFRAGDRIAPLGTDGHRKIKDVFIEARLPRSKRARWPIVELEDAIAWVPGIVRGRAALVGEATKEVMRVRAVSIA